MLPTSNRGRLWKLRFLGPTPSLAGFLVIPKDSGRGFPGVHPWESLGFHGIFKTGNRTLQMGPARRFDMQFYLFETDLSVCKTVFKF